MLGWVLSNLVYPQSATQLLVCSGIHPFSRRDEVPDHGWLKSSGEVRVEEKLRPDLQHRLQARDKVMAKKILNGCPPYHIDLRNLDKDGKLR